MTYPSRSPSPRSRRALIALAAATFTVGAAAQDDAGQNYDYFHRSFKTGVWTNERVTKAITLDRDGSLRDEVVMLLNTGAIAISYEPGVMTAVARTSLGNTNLDIAAVKTAGAAADFLLSTDSTSGLRAHAFVGTSIATTNANFANWVGATRLTTLEVVRGVQSLVIAVNANDHTKVLLARYTHGAGFTSLADVSFSNPVLALETFEWGNGGYPEIVALTTNGLEVRTLVGGLVGTVSADGNPIGFVDSVLGQGLVWLQPTATVGDVRVRCFLAGILTSDAVVSLGAGISADSMVTGDVDGSGSLDIVIGQNDSNDIYVVKGTGSSWNVTTMSRLPTVGGLGDDLCAPFLGQWDNHYAHDGIGRIRHGAKSVEVNLGHELHTQQNFLPGGSPLVTLEGSDAVLKAADVGLDGSKLDVRFVIDAAGHPEIEIQVWLIEGALSGPGQTVASALGTWYAPLHNQTGLPHRIQVPFPHANLPFGYWSGSPHVAIFARLVDRQGSSELGVASYTFPFAMALKSSQVQPANERDAWISTLPPFLPGQTASPEIDVDGDSYPTPPNSPWGPQGNEHKTVGKIRAVVPVPPPLPSPPVPGASLTLPATTPN